MAQGDPSMEQTHELPPKKKKVLFDATKIFNEAWGAHSSSQPKGALPSEVLLEGIFFVSEQLEAYPKTTEHSPEEAAEIQRCLTVALREAREAFQSPHMMASDAMWAKSVLCLAMDLYHYIHPPHDDSAA